MTLNNRKPREFWIEIGSFAKVVRERKEDLAGWKIAPPIHVREILPDAITDTEKMNDDVPCFGLSTPTKPTGSVSMDDIIDAEATKCALLYIGDESAHITKDCNLDILEHHFTQGSHFGYRMRDTEVKSLQTKLDVAMGVLSKFHDHNDPSMQYVNCIACIALSTINKEKKG